MSVVGFDLGNESCIVAVARQRGIDVVLNEESKRETPAIVCFGDKQRFIGTAGAASSTMNPKNSISQIKRLLGRKFSDPELQSDLASFPFRVTEGPDGFPLVHARYLGEERAFTPTQLLAMVLSNLKGIAEGNLNAAVVDCCIGIPVYFTDLQRRAVLDAATIAGLRPLRLFHETTATALAYGIYKTDLPENDLLNVAFVDVGHASMQVSVVGYKKGQLKMLSHTYDRSLGGRDFDEALFKHFAAKFKEEYKIDVYQNARACIRLRVACEKLKKMLSANPEAPLNIECLMDEKDVRGFIKRDEFEQISASVLERVKGPLEKALAEAGLTAENVHFVEVVGSGSRVPAIIKIITEFFGKEPRTMNASECVAPGCALQCAILSPTFKVREFQVNDGFPFSIALSWNGDSQNAPQQTLVFPKGIAIPSTKALTSFKSSTFEVDVLYVDQDDSQIQQKISTYTIGPFQTSKGEKAKLKVKVRLNIHGIVTVDSATMLEEEDVEVPVSSANEAPNDTTKMDTDDAPSDPAAGADVTMQEPQSADTTEAAPSCENRAQESEEKSSPMETGAKVEPSKKKIKKTTVPVHELVYGALAAADLQKEKEYDPATAAAAARGANMVQCTQPPPQLKLPESKTTELTDDENQVSQIKPADIELSGLQPHRLLQTIEKSPGGGSQCSLHEEIPTDANAIADAAWEALKRSIDMPEGAALNYDQVLMRDFIPSVLAFLMKGEHSIAKKILVETAVLIVGPLKLGANCKVHPRSPTQKAESLLADFGESEKHLDSALWWISLLHAYTERTGDNSLAKNFDCKRAMHLILLRCLSKDLNSFSIDTHNLFLMAMKCALSLLKQDSDADFVNRIKEKIQDLIYNLHSYHWLDLQMPIGTNTRTTLNKSNVPLESLPNLINFSRSRGGYFIGNASPTIMDFRWFCLGNFIAILSLVVTGEQAEAILNLVEENLDWLSGCDPKNTRWSYHNGGSWPVLSWPLVAVSVKLGRLHLARRAVELMEQQLANEGFPMYYDGKTQQYGVADYLVARSILDDPSHLCIVAFKEKYWDNFTDFEREELLKWTKIDESNRLIEKKESDDFDFGDIIHYCHRKASFLVNLELNPIKYGGDYRVVRTHYRGSTIYRWHNVAGREEKDFCRTILKLRKGPDLKNLRPVDDSMVLYEFRETEGPKEKVLWKFELKDGNSEVSSVINTIEDEIKTLKVESVEEQMQRRLKELELENAEKDRLLKELKLENAEKDKCLRKLEIDYVHMKDELGKKIELFNEGELLRKKLHNQIMDLKGHMRVFCRVRPLFGKEATVVTHPTPPTSLENAGREIQLIEKGKDVLYKFDKVFDSAASQEAIFKDIAELVQSALDGHKVTIFSYGQTGSGKTYTMIGKPNDEEEGMIPRAFKEIFRCIKSWEDNGWIYEVKASMLEIYCEKISDLLDNHKPCDIYDCKGEDVVLRIADKSKLEEKLICSAEKAYKLFEVASKCRTVGKTYMNDESSRSHFFFKLKINGYNKLSSEKAEGVLQMIDLAGSETCTGQTSDTQKHESKDINRSLSALTRLFGEIGRGDVHLSYRDSKLTRLLQGYFTGDSKVLMFINIAPELSCIGTTKNSLKVGCDVNNCKIKRKTENHKQQQKSDEIEESHMTHYKSKRDVSKQATVTEPRARGVQFGTSIKSPTIGCIGSCSKNAPICFRL